MSSEPMPPEFSRTISFGNFSYNLYSHSFLHFGQVTIFCVWNRILSFGHVLEVINFSSFQNAAHDMLWGSLLSRDHNSGELLMIL